MATGLIALQRAAGNAIVSRLIVAQLRRDDSGQEQPIQRLTVPDVLRSSGQPAVQRMLFHRGLTEEDARALTTNWRRAAIPGDQADAQRTAVTGNLANTGAGEFGKGVYFWEEDPEAALITALQYTGVDRAWAVVQYNVPDQTISAQSQAHRQGGTPWISFPDQEDPGSGLMHTA